MADCWEVEGAVVEVRFCAGGSSRVAKVDAREGAARAHAGVSARPPGSVLWEVS